MTMTKAMIAISSTANIDDIEQLISNNVILMITTYIDTDKS